MPNRKDIPKAGDPNAPDCPECKGLGVRRAKPSETKRHASSSRARKCPDCEGSGKVKKK